MDELQRGLADFGLTITQTQLGLFEQYFELLLDWNTRFNLTRITERQAVIEKHFLDSLSCFLALPQLPQRLIDVGSGAGFPGIPLKIMQPQLHLTLVETTQKKATFLQQLVQHLALDNVAVLHNRAEALGQDWAHRESYDLAMARAVASLPILAEYLLPFLKLGGVMLALKSKLVQAEVEEAEAAFATLGGQFEKTISLTLPGTHLERKLVLVHKVKPTPPRYPRKAGIPAKRPILGRTH